MSKVKTIQHLVWFELKHSLWHYLFLLLLSKILVVMSLAGEDLAKEGIFNFGLVIVQMTLVILCRPAVFRSSRVAYNTYAKEQLIHLQQLPLKKSDIALYQLIVNYILLIPLLVGHLMVIYLLVSPFREMLMPYQFMAFIMIWLMIGIVLLNVNAITDFGVNILWSYIYFFILILPLVILMIVLFNLFFDQGFSLWLVDLSRRFPTYVCLISLLVSGLSTYISYNICMKRMEKVDYFS